MAPHSLKPLPAKAPWPIFTTPGLMRVTSLLGFFFFFFFISHKHSESAQWLAFSQRPQPPAEFQLEKPLDQPSPWLCLHLPSSLEPPWIDWRPGGIFKQQFIMPWLSAFKAVAWKVKVADNPEKKSSTWSNRHSTALGQTWQQKLCAPGQI